MAKRKVNDAVPADEIDRLARLETLEYQRCRKDAAKQLGIGVTGLDKAVRERQRTLGKKADGEDRKPPQRDRLIALAAKAELWHDKDGTGYVTVEVNGHRENHRVRSRAFRDWLGRSYLLNFRGAAYGQALQDALNTIEAMACFDGDEREAHLRVAKHGEVIYLDLGDAEWRAVEITAEGWRVVSDPPVKFIRSRGMRPLPVPQPGGSVGDLRRFVNVANDSDFRLLVGWLVAAYRPRSPYPVLILNGEPGAAKSTAARALRALVDPNAAPIRSVPREERDLTAAARNGWVVAFDNVSGLPTWLADAICRLATGGGLGGRQLYTDHDEAVFEAQRPVILNGVPDLATRGDLADRAINSTLPQIPEDERKTEEEFWADFEAAKPRILGALLDAVSCALRRLPNVKLKRKPRMADFALWATAAEPGCGWPQGAFMDAYDCSRAAAVELTVEADAVAQAILNIVKFHDWTGTASELLKAINMRVPYEVRRQRGWPPDPTRLSSRVRRFAPALRAMGLDVELDDRTPDRNRSRIIRIRRALQNSVRSVRSVRQDGKPLNKTDSGPDARPDAEPTACVRANALEDQGADATDATDAKL